jgi:hypothetical protein
MTDPLITLCDSPAVVRRVAQQWLLERANNSILYPASYEGLSAELVREVAITIKNLIEGESHEA